MPVWSYEFSLIPVFQENDVERLLIGQLVAMDKRSHKRLLSGVGNLNSNGRLPLKSISRR